MQEVKAIHLGQLQEQVDRLAEDIDKFRRTLAQEGITVVEDWKLYDKTDNLPLPFGSTNLIALILEYHHEPEIPFEQKDKKLALILDQDELIRFAQNILNSFDPPREKAEQLTLGELQYLRGIIESQ